MWLICEAWVKSLRWLRHACLTNLSGLKSYEMWEVSETWLSWEQLSLIPCEMTPSTINYITLFRNCCGGLHLLTNLYELIWRCYLITLITYITFSGFFSPSSAHSHHQLINAPKNKKRYYERVLSCQLVANLLLGSSLNPCQGAAEQTMSTCILCHSLWI